VPRDGGWERAGHLPPIEPTAPDHDLDPDDRYHGWESRFLLSHPGAGGKGEGREEGSVVFRGRGRNRRRLPRLENEFGHPVKAAKPCIPTGWEWHAGHSPRSHPRAPDRRVGPDEGYWAPKPTFSIPT